jgi:ABC-type branched-subunit amino acid transport system permease subunit
MLLAFAIALVVAGMLSITSPDQNTAVPLATIAVVAVVAAAVVIAVAKMPDETYLQAMFNLFSMATAAIMLAFGIAPLNRTTMAGTGNGFRTNTPYDDTGQTNYLTRARRPIDGRQRRGFGHKGMGHSAKTAVTRS